MAHPAHVCVCLCLCICTVAVEVWWDVRASPVRQFYTLGRRKIWGVCGKVMKVKRKGLLVHFPAGVG